MRLDKFLKVSRLIKRRTVANEACDAGRVVVNGKVARASYDVKVGDEIVFDEGNAIPVTTNYDYTVTVKAKYQTIYYATFYEESAGGIVLTRKQVATDENGQAIIDISKHILKFRCNIVFSNYSFVLIIILKKHIRDSYIH